MLPPEPKVPTPERFSEERNQFSVFRNAFKLFFALQPQTFSLETTKVGFIIFLLQGELQSRAHRLLEQKDTSLNDLSTFFHAMSQVYEDPFTAKTLVPLNLYSSTVKKSSMWNYPEL